MKVWRVFAGAAVAIALAASQGQAQQFGVQVNYADDFDLGVGVRAELPLTNLLTSSGPLANTFLIGSFDYFFPDCDECSYMEFNANLAVPISTSSLRPYAGAGLHVARVSFDFGPLGDFSDTEVGLNVLGGLRFQLGGLSTYGEGRLELGGAEQLVLTFGVLLGGGN